MKNLLKIVLKGFLFGIGFVIGTFVIYAVGSLINSVTEQTINKGDKIGSGWFQDVNNKIISLIDNQTTISGEVSYNTERLNEIFRIGNQMNPGKSCKDILDTNPNTAGQDGIYWIDPDGDGGVSAFEVYCDMTTDGGGWIKIKLEIGENPRIIAENTDTNDCSTNGDFMGSNTDNTDVANYISFLSPSNICSSTNTNVTKYWSNSSNQKYDLEYKNPANGSFFTDGQLNVIRANISHLNQNTNMIGIHGDDELPMDSYIYNGSNWKKILLEHAGDESTIVSLVGTDGDSSLLQGYGDAEDYQVINSSYIIPEKIHFECTGRNGDSCRGNGFYFSYQKDYFLVK